MRKALRSAFIIQCFLAVAATAFLWVDSLVRSIYGYRSPMRGQPPLTDVVTQPLTSQVVLVVIDGLRLDAVPEMPTLTELREEGAQAVILSRPPSNAQTAWTTLVSGAERETSDAPPFDHALEWIEPIRMDHIFAATTRGGLTSGIAGASEWEKLVPPQGLYTHYTAGTAGMPADERIMDRALVFSNQFRPNLLLVHLVAADSAGSAYGGASAEYLEAVSACDQHIAALLDTLNLDRSVIIVLSSHGVTGRGTHGGAEDVVLRTPFVMAGQNVLPGDYGEIRLFDIAPTLAAILGTPTPAQAQGVILNDMLTMTTVDRAQKWVALASQRLRWASMYLYSIDWGKLRETAEGDMLVAVSSLQVKNYESAAELATLSVEQTDQEVTRAREDRIGRERMQRAGSLGLLALVLLAVLWRARSMKLVWNVVAALLAAILYHIVFLQQGHLYSWSDLPREGLPAAILPSLQRTALALAAGALLVLWRTWRDRQWRACSVVRRSFAYAGLNLTAVGLGIGACTWYNGVVFDWYLADLTVAYIHIMLLLQAMWIAVLALPLALALLTANHLLMWRSERRSRVAARAAEAGGGC
jgi:hypothetical protein